MSRYIFTSESVAEGHPDKVADQISDALVDLYLTYDPYSRCAIETLATTNAVVLAGEVRGSDKITHDMIRETTKQTIKKIGYEQTGFDWRNVDIDIKIHSQSADIAVGVDSTDDKDEGAGDQGIMFGFASNETDVLMPPAIHYSHKILQRLAEDRHKGILDMLGPDAKAQVSLIYENGKAIGGQSVVVSTQHKDGLSQADIRKIIIPYIEEILPQGWMPSADELYINPTGRFVIGGPDGDCGLTGRKIIVDTYGGSAPHGGGAFSGKDPTKVDRSAAYISRYLAKNIVAAGLSDKCTIQLSYAIGVSKPISVLVDLHGNKHINAQDVSDFLQSKVSLSPRGIREHLNLNKAIYLPSAAYGHFGRTPTSEGHFSWEKTDLVDALKTTFSHAL
tara:strand:- start:39 stop:1211 length:1173 start_codon:yes stop_codon:yes gene_type:complete